MKPIVTGFFVIVILLLVVVWILDANDLAHYAVFAPRPEAIRRHTFEQSKAYNQGMVQNMEHEHLEYIRDKNPEERAAIASIVLHDAADYPEDQLPTDLTTWIDQLRSEQH